MGCGSSQVVQISEIKQQKKKQDDPIKIIKSNKNHLDYQKNEASEKEFNSNFLNEKIGEIKKKENINALKKAEKQEETNLNGDLTQQEKSLAKSQINFSYQQENLKKNIIDIDFLENGKNLVDPFEARTKLPENERIGKKSFNAENKSANYNESILNAEKIDSIKDLPDDHELKENYITEKNMTHQINDSFSKEQENNTKKLDIQRENIVQLQKNEGIKEITSISKIPFNQESKRLEPSFVTLPDLDRLIQYTFSELESKMIPGKQSSHDDKQEKPSIHPSDTIADLAIVSTFYQNFCYVDGQYNNNNWMVTKGFLEKQGIKYDAYRVNPPKNKAKQFLASHHFIYYRFPKKANFDVLIFEENSLKILQIIKNESIIEGEFIKISEADLSIIEHAKIFVFALSFESLSVFQEISNGVFGATIFESKDQLIPIKIEVRTYSINFDCYIPEDFSFGPDSHENIYTTIRVMFTLQEKEKLGVFTQDKNTKQCFLLWIIDEGMTITSIAFESIKGFYLVAACQGSLRDIYYVLVQEGNSGDLVSTRTLYLIRADAESGHTLKKVSVDGSIQGLNIYEMSTSCVLSLKGSYLAMLISRNMSRSGDGLNHQGGICCIFDSKSLSLIRNHGQTSGHSFGCSLISSDEEFFGMDLGDNYPRGIHLFKFTGTQINFRLVYAMKTCHGIVATSPAGKTYPEYTKISTAKHKFYKWSNDNRTYTELAAIGLHKMGTALGVFFVGESPALDCSKSYDKVNTARNIGFVKVDQELEKVLSEGKVETGGFFNFGGGWVNQKNEGVKWLTNREDKNVNVSRLKSVSVGKNRILLVFEVWSMHSYMYTAFGIVNHEGEWLISETKLDFPIRVHKADDLTLWGNAVIFFSGNKERKIQMICIKID